jgi:hypothetical protein
MNWMAAATLCLATQAIAGEVTGSGRDTPVRSYRAASICSFSGLNDDAEGPSTRVQAYGALIASLGPGYQPSPGIACRGN